MLDNYITADLFNCQQFTLKSIDFNEEISSVLLTYSSREKASAVRCPDCGSRVYAQARDTYDLKDMPVFYQLFFFFVVKGPETAASLAPGENDLPHGCREVLLYEGLLRQITDLIFLQPVTDQDLTADRLLQVEQCFHKRGLAGPVFTYDTEIIPCIHGEIQTLHDGMCVVAERQIPNGDVSHMPASYFNASFRTDRFFSMMERYVVPFSTSFAVTDCMESMVRICWSFACVFCTMVSAIR